MPAMISRKAAPKKEHTGPTGGENTRAGLRLEAVSKTYTRKAKRKREHLTVLDQVSFSARSGEFVAIIGPSGCGKSTVLNAIAGLTDYEGTIRCDGQRITAPGPERAVVFQHASLLPWRSVEENVAFGLRLRRQYTDGEIGTKVTDALERVGLAGFDKHYPHQISGGMQQRVNIARALVVEPQLMLMDEPFGALDALTREALQDQLFEIINDRPRTTLFVTHDIVEAVYLADKIVVMSARPGRIITELAVDFARPRSRDIEKLPEFESLVHQMRTLLHPGTTR